MKSLLAIFWLFGASLTWAHGGEDHGEAAAAVSAGLAPRAAAASEDFEAVVVAEAGRLIVYLDDFASNRPVTGASVEISGEGIAGLAAEIAPGSFALPLAQALPAKRHALTLAVSSADSADLLTLTLEITAPPAASTPAASGAGVAAKAASALLLLALALFARQALKRRRQKDHV